MPSSDQKSLKLQLCVVKKRKTVLSTPLTSTPIQCDVDYLHGKGISTNLCIYLFIIFKRIKTNYVFFIRLGLKNMSKKVKRIHYIRLKP